MEGRGVEQDIVPYVGQLELANVPVEAWIKTLMYMVSLMVLVVLCASLSTMDKLSTLM